MKRQLLAAENYCCSVRDGTHDTPVPTSSGFKLVTGKHIKNGVIDPYDAYYISEDDFNSINARSRVEKWDVLMSMIGTVGEAAVVADTPLYAIKNVALFKCGGSEIKGKWLAYYLRSEEAKGHMRGNMKGSSQQFLSLKQLRSLPIPIASEHEMKKIVNVLSAYDDLIENNRKQIKLLEEAAQRLYEEWFIDLRFPGYENTKIINGIPEGWKLTNLGTLGAFVRGKTITKDQTCSGNIPVVAGGLTPAYYHNAPNTDVPVITVSGSGANAGFSNMYFQKIWASDCSYLEKSKTQGFFFVYCFLKSNQEMLDNLQKGSAQPHVYAKDINAIAFYKPQDDVLQNFEYKTSPLFEQIANLQTSIKKATETRDRLLPKLMTGELEVEP